MPMPRVFSLIPNISMKAFILVSGNAISLEKLGGNTQTIKTKFDFEDFLQIMFSFKLSFYKTRAKFNTINM